MGHRNLPFVLCLALFAGTVHAQDTLYRKTSAPYQFWTAKLPLLNLLDPNAPNLQLAMERRFDKHNSVQLLGGISTDFSTTKPKPHDYSFVNGFRLKAEYRRYFHVRRKVAFFLAGDVFYTSYRHYTDDSFISKTTNLGYTDNYYVRKKMAGADLKWGFQFHAGKHLLFETFAGLGFKHKTVTETGRTSPFDEHVPPPSPVDINLSSETNALGSYTTVSLPINFVICYNFR